MRLSWKGFAATAAMLVFLASPMVCRATSCTTQAALLPQTAMRSPQPGDDWPWPWPSRICRVEGRSAARRGPGLGRHSSEAQVGAVLMKGGQVQLRSLYLLDATSLERPPTRSSFARMQRLGDRDPDHACAAAGPVCRGVGRCGRSALRRPVGFIWPGTDPPADGKLGGLTVRPAHLMDTMACLGGGGRTPANWPGLIRIGSTGGAHGTPTMPRGCSSCRWTFSPRRIWKNS